MPGHPPHFSPLGSEVTGPQSRNFYRPWERRFPAPVCNAFHPSVPPSAGIRVNPAQSQGIFCQRELAPRLLMAFSVRSSSGPHTLHGLIEARRREN